MDIHTDGNAVPPVDGTELGNLLEDLDGVHAGIGLIRDGIRLLALSRLTPEQTQTVIVTLAGSADGTDVLTAIGQLVARLTNPDTNPGLRELPLDRQKNTQLHGELLVHHLAAPDLHQHASDASGSIHTD
ncbi:MULTISPECIES: hypothetical protein [unclassified Streptomyces]|uniref:hypothetical protein n=1 Tax=unclassified Streptomyces TaxID=2593676 RepID=UPI0036E0E9D6